METVGEDDPYGDLVKFCRITSSQEQKLQTCPFARADETFLAAFDSLGSSFSQAMTQSPPPVITMVSLSDSDEEDEEPPNDDNALLENDVYQTPPEEHNTSYCSSQEDIQRNPQLVPVVGEKTEEEIGKDGDSAPGLEIIGFPEQLEATRDGELNEFGVSGENSGEPPWKKIRVSGVNWESPMLNTVQEEEVIAVIASQQASDYADDVDVDDGELIDMVIESDEEIGSDGADSDEEIGPDGAGRDEEIGLDGAGNGDGEEMSNCVKNGGEMSVASGGDLVVEEIGGSKKSVSSDGDLAVEEVGNGKRSVSGDGDLVEEVRNGRCVNSAGMDRGHICAFKYATGGGGNNGDQQRKELVRKKLELPASMREKCSDRERQKGDKVGDNGNVEAKVLSWKELFDTLAKIENKKVDRDDGEGMSTCVKNGGEKSVASDGDLVVEEVGGSKKSVSSDGDLAVEEVGNGKKSVSSDADLVEKVRNDRGVKSAGMDREDICALKYAAGMDGDQQRKEPVSKKRELPASIREKCSDGQKQKGDKVGDNKVLSWKELLDRLAKIMKYKKVDRDAEEEHPDFLETLKRRGMTFPTPRWKSP